MNARQVTARKKQKNQAPTYCPVVVGLNALEKIWVAVFWVLNVIIMAIVMSEAVMGMLEDMVEVAEGEADMDMDMDILIVQVVLLDWQGGFCK